MTVDPKATNKNAYFPAVHDAHFYKCARAYVALIAGLILTVGAAYYETLNASLRSRMEFEHLATQARTAASTELETYGDVLNDIRGLYGASVSVERNEFRAYIDTARVFERYPAIDAIGFIERVSAGHIRTFAARVSHDISRDAGGYPEFKIFPPGMRDEHLVVTYIEPMGTSERSLLGYDVVTNRNFRAAIACIRQTERACATAPLAHDFSTVNSRNYFTIMVPIYRNGVKPKVLTGYAFGLVSLQRLVNRIDAGTPAIDIDLFDRNAAATHRQAALTRDTHSLQKVETFASLGRSWDMHVRASPRLTERTLYSAKIALVGGTAVSFLLFVAVNLRTRNIAQQRAQDAALTRQAQHDALTGLPNRYFLYEHLQRVLSAASADTLTLLLIDLNGFKEINDTLGHDSGDEALKQIGQRLRQSLASEDVVVRLGGDEFAIALHAGNDDHIRAIAERLQREINRPFMLAGVNIGIDASIGIAVYPRDGDKVATLMRCADVAMYLAKQTAVGYAVYESARDEHTPRRLSLLAELSEAIAQDQLVLHYQPIVDLKNGKVVSVEALLRWQHPRYGLIPPDQFIPTAEKNAIIKPLTLWVAKNSLQQIQCWRDRGFDLDVAINISPRNLLDPELQARITELLADCRIEPRRLMLEITETAIMNDATRSLETLARLHKLGITIGIDDFGTGYSSLNYLKQLPAHCLKIDRSFIKDLAHTENDAAIVRHTIALAHSLKMSVVAEGVETDEAFTLLCRLGCDRAQGYYIARPLPASQLTQWLQTRVLGSPTTSPRAGISLT